MKLFLFTVIILLAASVSQIQASNKRGSDPKEKNLGKKTKKHITKEKEITKDLVKDVKLPCSSPQNGNTGDLGSSSSTSNSSQEHLAEFETPTHEPSTPISDNSELLVQKNIEETINEIKKLKLEIDTILLRHKESQLRLDNAISNARAIMHSNDADEKTRRTALQVVVDYTGISNSQLRRHDELVRETQFCCNNIGLDTDLSIIKAIKYMLTNALEELKSIETEYLKTIGEPEGPQDGEINKN